MKSSSSAACVGSWIVLGFPRSLRLRIPPDWCQFASNSCDPDRYSFSMMKKITSIYETTDLS